MWPYITAYLRAKACRVVVITRALYWASGSQLFFDTAGSSDKTLKLYEGHFHDLLNDVDKEVVMADIKGWIDARLKV